MTFAVCALNEERWIEGTVRSLTAIADEILDEYDLVLVDDGGRDRTGQIMEDLARGLPNVRVIHNPEPRGLGWIFWELVNACKHPYFMMLAGNGESAPEAVRRMIESTGTADVIIGYRTRQQRSFIRSAFSAGFQRAMWISLGFPFIRDWTGMFVWPVEPIRGLERLPPSNLYSVEVLVRLLERGVSVNQVPAPQGPERGKSKVVGFKTLKQTARLLLSMQMRRRGSPGAGARRQ